MNGRVTSKYPKQNFIWQMQLFISQIYIKILQFLQKIKSVEYISVILGHYIMSATPKDSACTPLRSICDTVGVKVGECLNYWSE